MASAGGSTSPRSLKRQHEDDVVQEQQPIHTVKNEEPSTINSAPGSPTTYNCSRLSTPARTETDSLSEIGSSTPPLTHAPPATAFSALNGNSQPPKKKMKLTYAEQEEKRMLKEIKDRERQEEKAKKEAEKREKEQDKARREAEREAERKKREADREEKRLVKEVERAERERERKAKEDEKRKKEEEKLRIEEEKKKKERSQKKLNAFFTKAPALKPSPMKATSPGPSTSTSTMTSPSKKAKSEYEAQFSSFFIKENVTLAPTTRFERDETAVGRLEKVLDSYIIDQKAPKRDQSFNASELFNIPTSLAVRGKSIIPVKDIMSQILGGASRPIDLTTDSQNSKIKNTRNLLKAVPYKILKFAEDVRPPYTGTYTKLPLSGMRTLARNPTKRDLPGVDYDYDSEAEWEEPGEDEEDLGSEGEDEEDDGEEDLDGFLDDAEDETINARKLVMNGDLEPKVTGLCWEDEKGRGPELKMYGYVMEVMHGISSALIFRDSANTP
jgi:chromatin assembly factor 1 subunit A